MWAWRDQQGLIVQRKLIRDRYMPIDELELKVQACYPPALDGIKDEFLWCAIFCVPPCNPAFLHEHAFLIKVRHLSIPLLFSLEE